MSILVLLAIALAPGVCIVLYIYLKDMHEREPVSLLIKSFLFGILAIIVTLVVSIPIDLLIPIEDEDLSEQAVHAFLLVALVEESSKFLFVRGVLYNNDHFNEPFDGIVYSVMVGMGFATLENIFYVIEGGVGIGLMRMFTAVPAHATFAVMMGFFVGRAKFDHKRIYFSLYGLLTATFFHGAYDYFFFINFVPGMGFGASASLAVGIMLSHKAIRIHQAGSPFHPERAGHGSEPMSTHTGSPPDQNV
jgi:RsiW-degrading membrane proteinase PrsW (M82 family)